MKVKKRNTSSSKYVRGMLNSEQIKKAPALVDEWKEPEPRKEYPTGAEITKANLWDSCDLKEKYSERFVPDTPYIIMNGKYFEVEPVERGRFTSYNVVQDGKTWKNGKLLKVNLATILEETKENERPEPPKQLELF